MSSQIERDSFHESGHAVVAILLGIPIDGVGLSPGEHRGGWLKFTSLDCQQDAVVIAGKAGRIAECFFDSSASHKPRSQDEKIIWLTVAGRMGSLSPEFQEDYFRCAELEAERLVAKHWGTIAALAAELILKRTLTGEAATAFVKQRLPARQPDE